jgi:hypothetical protein
LELLEKHPAGIGDHSTTDFYKNAEEALQMLVDADDRLGAIEKYFGKEMLTGGIVLHTPLNNYIVMKLTSTKISSTK